MNYSSNIEEEYEGDVLITLLGSIDIKEEGNKALFNGYVSEEEIINKDTPQYTNIKTSRRSPLQLRYNNSNDTLYVSLGITLKSKIKEFEVKEILDWYKEYLKGSTAFKDKLLMFGETKVDLELYSNNQEYFVTQSQLVAPKGYIFLEEIFEAGEDNFGYPEFLNNQLMYNRLVSICTKAGKKIPDGAVSGHMLPIHVNDPTTGSTLVLKDVKSVYKEYKFAQNYIRGFEEGSQEHQTGRLMMLVPSFASYMLSIAQRAVLGSKPKPERHQAVVLKAIKFVNKYRGSYLDGRDVNEQIEIKVEEN